MKLKTSHQKLTDIMGRQRVTGAEATAWVAGASDRLVAEQVPKEYRAYCASYIGSLLEVTRDLENETVNGEPATDTRQLIQNMAGLSIYRTAKSMSKDIIECVPDAEPNDPIITGPLYDGWNAAARAVDEALVDSFVDQQVQAMEAQFDQPPS